jgi:hypothetical protein
MVKTSKPTILHLTVDQLHRSDLNVRKKPSSAASDAEVSASLLSVGLIQPMVVIPREAGGMRWWPGIAVAVFSPRWPRPIRAGRA